MSSPTVPVADCGRLSGVSKTPWLSARIPWKRHRDKINVAFADGHAKAMPVGQALQKEIWVDADRNPDYGYIGPN